MDDKHRILPHQLEKEMKTSFIAYAMAVIIDRALPDVRDGLKPVHRRILYSMSELGLQPDKPYRKSARIVGDVLGKYHPHGDTAVYDAMVRLAQDFSTRYPLVEGHGNFGSVDGDGAAAMRYTEARMSKLTTEMMADIEKDTVDFYPNFDETLTQPSVMPCRFPNLLVNGSGGIAVGMATNMPPHNLGEVIDGLVAMIDNPDISLDDLMSYIPGPDFPTGATILGKMGITSAYRTGRGRIVVRAKAEIEPMSANRSRIIVTEIPYQVNKARMVERIADLVHQKKIEGISDLRDETDRTGTRIVIELKRDVNPEVLLNNLYKHTDMQTTFGVINLALVDGEPKVLNLKQLLYYYLEHQRDVVTRRTRFDLKRALERLHILEGLLIALDNIDEVVALIKSSASAAEAKARLNERFGLSERQAQAVLDMRLQRLVGLERDKLVAEKADLEVKVEYYRSLLADEHLLMGVIKQEALEVKAKYSDPRRTEITQMIEDIDLDDVIQQEDMIVTLTHFGYVKRVSPDVFKAQNRGGRGVKGQTTREEDFVERIVHTNTHALILFFTNKGRVYRIKCYAIPESSKASKGMPVVNLLHMGEGEFVTAMFPLDKADEDDKYLVTATRMGMIKKTRIDECMNIRKGGLMVHQLREDDYLISVELSKGNEDFMVCTHSGKSIRFNECDVRATGRGGLGVRAIKVGEDDRVVEMCKVIPNGNILTVTEKGMGKRTPEEQYNTQGRGGKGITVMKLTERTGELVCMKVITDDEDLLLVRNDGTVLRMPIPQVPIIGRATQGVRMMRVDDGSRLAWVAVVPHMDESDEESDVVIDAPESVEAVEAETFDYESETPEADENDTEE